MFSKILEDEPDETIAAWKIIVQKVQNVGLGEGRIVLIGSDIKNRGKCWYLMR